MKEKLSRKRSESKGKGLSAREVFRNEAGAIDLASIMVGIIVIGLIGGVIAATVFTVIPWSQDNAAKQQLDSIAAAESAYMGLSSAVPSPLPVGYAANSFGTSAQLVAANLLTTGNSYCAVTPTDGKSYTGYSKSASGKVWYITDKNTKPSIPTDPVPAECGFTADGTTPAPPASYVDPTPTLTTLTYKCDTTMNGSLPWQKNLTGIETWDDGSPVRTYANATVSAVKSLTAGKTYKVTLDGTYTDFHNNTSTIRECLRSVDYWGNGTGVTNASNAFRDAKDLNSVPTRLPSTITAIDTAFMGATNFNQNINDWDVSNVTSLANIFRDAKKFNQPLDKWNTSKVLNMGEAFSGAADFNQNINSWDTSKVTNMNFIFYQAYKFNQPLDNWKIGNVTTMYGMFYQATAFNQPLASWNTSNVTDMGALFYQATAFNQDINSWQTGNVTKMNSMFYSATAFNQPLNSWQTVNVKDMSYMFYSATAFNQPLNNWITNNVTNMASLFENATKFNQNIKLWNITKVTNAGSFRTGSALAAANSPF